MFGFSGTEAGKESPRDALSLRKLSRAFKMI
jgi:hypothetical protein